MTMRMFRPTWAALAVLTLASQADAQTATGGTEKLETVTVTGSLIKRTDKETPSVVQVISREDIRNSGYATVEDMLRATSAVDNSFGGSVQDGASSGFVSGVATLSLRGFGAQGTLVLINGRRIAPVAAVDINFGRGSLINVNTIPKGAIERVEILKDGASALYGSDAMAGVINYVLRKDFEGIEANAGYTVSDTGVGATKSGGASFGFGNLAEKGFNVFGGIEASRRSAVWHSELKDRGNLELFNQYQNLSGVTSRFTSDSVASNFGSYYRVPASLAGSTTISGISVPNSNLQGVNYLGTKPGCAPENTVGVGVPTRPDGFLSTTPSLRTGACRYNLDDADQAIAPQDRVSGVLRANLALGSSLTAYADLMYSSTKTVETGVPRAFNNALVTSGNAFITPTPKLDGTFVQHGALILPVGHPDNPANEPVQLIYRFVDLGADDTTVQKSLRATVGLEGSVGAWDFDSALLLSKSDSKRTQQNRLRNDLLYKSIAAGTYRFNGSNNTEAAKASVASDAVNEGDSKITAIDFRASRDLFEMGGGRAAVALGLEARREELTSTPDANYLAGNYIGLVANGASGSRDQYAAFGELRLPVLKALELQAALRQEKFSDFGNSTTGKLGFKWNVLPSTLALRGTAATGFRAPSISQIGNSFALSFHSNNERRVFDNLRCNSSNPAAPVSRSVPPNARDCNVVGATTGVPVTDRPGSIPTVIAANPNLKPEESKSFTTGLVFSPTKHIDMSIDAWYFRRNQEIRASRGIDIMDVYNADPVANANLVIRNTNPASWLPGVANSGPIVALVRRYDNFNWSKTQGIDWDLNIRLPETEVGRFSVRLNGSYTKRFDVQVISGTAPSRWVGTTSSDIPKSKATAQLDWRKDNWRSWARLNHQDKLERLGTTGPCLSSTAATDQIRQSTGGCFLGSERSYDAGLSYRGFKGWVVAASVLNLTNDYGRSIDVPQSFNFWDSGTSSMLGRRYSLNVSYELN
jgi:iron complex outermembrane receptor protein